MTLAIYFHPKSLTAEQVLVPVLTRIGIDSGAPDIMPVRNVIS
jgi:hypothetical protein